MTRLNVDCTGCTVSIPVAASLLYSKTFLDPLFFFFLVVLFSVFELCQLASSPLHCLTLLHIFPLPVVVFYKIPNSHFLLNDYLFYISFVSFFGRFFFFFSCSAKGPTQDTSDLQCCCLPTHLFTLFLNLGTVLCLGHPHLNLWKCMVHM